MSFKTEQETFWRGPFGDEYSTRNSCTGGGGGNPCLLGCKTAFWAKILSRTGSVKNVIEFGSNIGLNLIAIKSLMPTVNEISAIEINDTAVKAMRESKAADKIYAQSILEFVPDYKRELAFTMGVLIHINPNELNDVYQKLYESSSKYILIAEYYDPAPVTIKYRGNENRLFKRDFAGEILTKYSDLELTDYGFIYHGDKSFPLDDITWFLLRKKGE